MLNVFAFTNVISLVLLQEPSETEETLGDQSEAGIQVT